MLALTCAALTLVLLAVGPTTSEAMHIEFADAAYPTPPTEMPEMDDDDDDDDDTPLNVTTLTKADILKLLCDDLPDTVKDCQEESRKRRETVLSEDAAAPEKRHYRYWRPYYRKWWGRPYWHYYKWRTTTTTQSPTATTTTDDTNSTILICPNPLDQSAPYKLSDSSAEYPADDIAEEMLANINAETGLGRFLLLYDFIDTSDSRLPEVTEDDFRESATASCPASTSRLYSFDSLINVQNSQRRCWVMQNFGTVVTYKTCEQRFCNDRSSGDSEYQNLCVPEYEVAYFWAYCPQYPALERFRRDYVIVADECLCNRVKCDKDT